MLNPGPTYLAVSLSESIAARVKNEWSHNSIVTIRLHNMFRDFTCYRKKQSLYLGNKWVSGKSVLVCN